MKTLKELYLEAARVAELEEQYPTIFPIRYKNNYYNTASLINAYINWNSYRGEIEFALAVVEGKPVFKGDELWHGSGSEFTVLRSNATTFFGESHNSACRWEIANCSWNPPKPHTVMVELLVEDASYVANVGLVNTKMVQACRKALEELKS